MGVPRLALLSPLLVLLVRVRESGFCWTIWIRFFYSCGGCAVYFVFSTFLLFQILYCKKLIPLMYHTVLLLVILYRMSTVVLIPGRGRAHTGR